MRKTLAVSIEGDRELRDALNQLAKEKQVTLGKLIADAVDAKYGSELKPLISFFRKRGYVSIQLDKETEHA